MRFLFRLFKFMFLVIFSLGVLIFVSQNSAKYDNSLIKAKAINISPNLSNPNIIRSSRTFDFKNNSKILLSNQLVILNNSPVIIEPPQFMDSDKLKNFETLILTKPLLIYVPALIVLMFTSFRLAFHFKANY